MGIEVRLHDQIRRLAVRQPDPADRRDRGADHDGVAHGAGGAAASVMMMTSVRIVSPIIETPSRMPDATATTAVTEMTVGQDQPAVAAEQRRT